jgi:hypothetical protein
MMQSFAVLFTQAHGCLRLYEPELKRKPGYECGVNYSCKASQQKLLFALALVKSTGIPARKMQNVITARLYTFSI